MNNARERQKRTGDSSLGLESTCFKDDDRTAADDLFIIPDPEENESNEPNSSGQNLSYDMSIKTEDIKEETTTYSSWSIVGYNEEMTVKTEVSQNATGHNDSQEVVSTCDYKEQDVKNHNDVKTNWETYNQFKFAIDLKQHEDFDLFKNSPYYQCKFCEYKSKEKQCLMQHFKVKHDNEIELLQCRHCDYTTKVKHTMKMHVKKNHMVIVNADWLRCQYCEYRAISDAKLKHHLKMKHTESTEWHQCEFCDFKTNRRYTLKRHFTTKHDTEAKWYQCQLCDFRTKSKENLPRHLSVIHNKDAEMYKCHLCDAQYTQRRSLLSHLVMKHDENSWHQCRLCRFKTLGESDLARHIKAKHDKTM